MALIFAWNSWLTLKLKALPKKSKNCQFGRSLNKVRFLTNKSIFLWSIKMTRRVTLDNKILLSGQFDQHFLRLWLCVRVLNFDACVSAHFYFFFQKFLLRLLSNAKGDMHTKLEHSSSKLSRKGVHGLTCLQKKVL